MTPRWRWFLSLLARRLWFRASLISLLGVAAALLSLLAAPYLPDGISARIGAESVGSILTIIASSMLAVTTFSLSTMVSAYSAATSNVTPRATKLLIEDSVAQNVLGTFVGSFLYSLVALIALSAGIYGDRGRLVLFVVTIGVALLIVVTLLTWIDYLLRFGRVGETTASVEKAATEALEARHRNQFLGGAALLDDTLIPQHALAVLPDRIGYVQHVDTGVLSEWAEAHEVRLYLVAPPGTFIDLGRPLAWIEGAGDEDAAEAVRSAFTVASERTFEQDPRFGLCVLAEIASRALSSATNDPGTAIDVIGRVVRLLTLWSGTPEPSEPRYPRVFVKTIEPSELFDDFFHPVARDSAADAEVQIRLQKALAALARCSDPRFEVEARRHSLIALKRAERAMTLPDDFERVRFAATSAFEARRGQVAGADAGERSVSPGVA